MPARLAGQRLQLRIRQLLREDVVFLTRDASRRRHLDDLGPAPHHHHHRLRALVHPVAEVVRVSVPGPVSELVQAQAPSVPVARGRA